MITSYKHDELIKNGISVGQKINNNLLKVNVYTSSQLYSTRLIKITDINDVEYECTYYLDAAGNSYLYNGEPNYFSGINAGDSLFTMITFDVNADNEALTFIDIHNRFTTTPKTKVIFGIEMLGGSALLNVDDRRKLENIKYRRLYPELGVTGIGSFFPIGCIKLDETGASHVFELQEVDSNKSIILIQINHNGNDGWDVKLLSNSSIYSPKLNINTGTSNGVKYFGIDVALVKSGAGIDHVFKVYHHVANVADVVPQSAESYLINLTPWNYVDYYDPTNFGNTQKDIKLSNSIREIGSNGISEFTLVKEDFPHNSDFNDYYLDGKYDYNGDDFSNFQHLPADLNRPFSLKVECLHKLVNEYAVKQTVTSTDINGNVMTWVRVLRQTTNTDWVFLQTSEYWINPVDQFSQLSPLAKLGYVSFVKNEAELYYFTGVAWTRLNRIVSEISNGILTAGMYSEFFIQSGISKKSLTKNNTYYHRNSTLAPEEIELISENVIDFVPRVELLRTIGENVVMLGNTVLTSGTNSVGAGYRINTTGTNNIMFGSNLASIYDQNTGIGDNLIFGAHQQIMLGKYNVGNPDNEFEIGNGIENARSNLFEISKTGIIKATGYATKTGDGNHLLLDDGTTIHKDSVGQSSGYARNEFTFIYDGITNVFELPEGITSVELPIFVNSTPIFAEDIVYNQSNNTVAISSSVLFSGDTIKIYAVSSLSGSNDSIMMISENTILGLEHNGKLLFVNGNNIAITIPTNLPNQYKVEMDFSGNLCTVVNQNGTSGTEIYNIKPNSTLRTYKIANITRVNGSFS